ncbi:MAG: asparaginase [Bacilli bacterium]
MKKVVILATGGTIASEPTEEGKLRAGAMSGERLAAQCNVPEGIKLEVHSIFQLPSMHLTYQHWFEMKQKIEEIFQDDSVDGIVITHGTDSMEESAYYYDLAIHDDRPIIFTGSQRSLSDASNDVYVNIRHAVLCAASEHLRDFGTLVCFNERVFTARYVKKVHASNVQGFSVFGFGYVGIVDHDEVIIYQKPLSREYIQHNKAIEGVPIVKSYLGATDEYLEFLRKNSLPKGIVIEGVGRGQVSLDMTNSIKKMIQDGVVVVITTSAEEGRVHDTYDYDGSGYDLKKAGAILGTDYDSKKARIKLAMLLSAGCSKDEIIKHF